MRGQSDADKEGLYVCEAPDLSEVALIHLPCAFPDDIHAEVARRSSPRRST